MGIDGHAMEEVSDDLVNSSLSKAQKKRLKKKKVRDEKRLAREQRKKPVKCEEPPVSSSIALPTKKKASTLDTDEKLLAEIKSRFEETSKFVLHCRPVPEPCPPGLLKDICPLAISVRLPMKRSARYAFLVFRNEYEMQLTEENLASKRINGKPIKVSRCCQPPRNTSPDGGDQWCPPGERTLADINCKKLLVSRLGRATTRFDLAQVFRHAVAVKLPTYDDGSCKGTCILTYKSRDAALHAFQTRHGSFIRGSPIYVNFMLKSKSQPTRLAVAAAADRTPTHADNKDAPRRSTKRPAEDTDQWDEADEQPDRKKSTRLDPTVVTPTVTLSQTASLRPKAGKEQPVASQKKLSTAKSHPQLLAPHQLKRAGGRPVKAALDARLSALEALLSTQSMAVVDSLKPKQAKKVKRRAAKNKGVKMVGKRGR